MATTWIFTREQMDSTPSRQAGIDADRELLYRQQTATLIQDMGQRLNVPQLVINTAIVYMHRFFMFHSFKDVQNHLLAQAAIFLAAKVEDQPRKLEHVLRVAETCLSPHEAPLNPKHVIYLQRAQDLIMLETMLLQTLGFAVTVVHPHTHVVKCSQLVRASKDLAHTSYFMATNSLHLTTLCLRYAPSVVACVCIHLACKWSNWEIPMSSDGQPWWVYVDSSVTLQLLDELTQQFLDIMEKTPNRMKRIRNWKIHQSQAKKKCVEVTSKSSAGGDNIATASCSKPPCAGTSSATAVTSRPWHQTQHSLMCIHEAPDGGVDLKALPPKQPPACFSLAGGDGGASECAANFFLNDNGLGSVDAAGGAEGATLARCPAPHLGVAPNVTIGQPPLSSCTFVHHPPAPNAPAAHYPVPFCGPRLELNQAFACNMPNPDVALNPAMLVPSFVSTSEHMTNVNPSYVHQSGVVPVCDISRALPTHYIADPNAGPSSLAAMATREFAGAHSVSGQDLQPCSLETLRPFGMARATVSNVPRYKPSREQSRTVANSLPNPACGVPMLSFHTVPPVVRSGHRAQSSTVNAADGAKRSNKKKLNGDAKAVRSEAQLEIGGEMQHRHLVNSHSGDGKKDVFSHRATEAPNNNSQASYSCMQSLPTLSVANDQTHRQWPPQYSLHRDSKTQFTETQNIDGFQGAACSEPNRALQQHHSLAKITSGPSTGPDIGSKIQPAKDDPTSSANKKRALKRRPTSCHKPERSSKSTSMKPEVEGSNRLPPPKPISRLPLSPNICTTSLSPDSAFKVDGVASAGSCEPIPHCDAQQVAIETEKSAQRSEWNEGDSVVYTVVPGRSTD